MSRRTIAARRRYNQMVLEEWDHHELAGRSKFTPSPPVFPCPVVDRPDNPWAKVGRHLRAVTVHLNTDRHLRRMGVR